MLNLEKSSQAFAQAKEVMPGGVNSPVRSFARVKCDPPFIAKASGSKIYDIDGNEYIDYVGSWGPMIVGHAHPNDLIKIINLIKPKLLVPIHSYRPEKLYNENGDRLLPEKKQTI